MSPGRLEPFQQALNELRERLREGQLPPGARVTAKEVADAIRLSATPVREALSRLAGEGVLEERRGDGFFVRGLASVDIADLYRLSLGVLSLAQRAGRQPHRDLARETTLSPEEDPVRAVERLFLAWVAESASRVLVENHRIIALRLAPVRRLERRVLLDLRPEAEGLLALADAGGRAARPAALEAFHARRIGLADQLAELLDPDGAPQV
jgi:DNA-binding GntR family transcriptional regulator